MENFVRYIKLILRYKVRTDDSHAILIKKKKLNFLKKILLFTFY